MTHHDLGRRLREPQTIYYYYYYYTRAHAHTHTYIRNGGLNGRASPNRPPLTKH